MFSILYNLFIIILILHDLLFTLISRDTDKYTLEFLIS